jgi:hypothetical protein
MWQHWNSPLGEAEPRAIGHVATPEPTSVGRRGTELRNTRQYRSSPLREVRPGQRGRTGAHLDRKARSGAEKHMAVQ